MCSIVQYRLYPTEVHRCHLSKEFPEPDVQLVRVPMYLKKSVGRTVVDHPTRVASIMIRQELTKLGFLGSQPPEPADVSSFLEPDASLSDLYIKHPVTIKAFEQGFKQEHVVPISVYFDGVQYTKNENFLGFYVTNLRTGVQRLVWLLRISASLSQSVGSFQFLPDHSILFGSILDM